MHFFDSIRGLLKKDPVCIDSSVFRLHRKFTAGMLLMFSLLVTTQQYFGDPIDCVVEGIDQKIMDTYCWMQSTYTMPDKVRGVVGVEVPHPGVAPDGNGGVTKYHSYYQWVFFFFFGQAVFFQLPYRFWKWGECGRLRKIVKDLEGKKKVSYRSYNFLAQDSYAYWFFFCEFLNWVNVVGQVFLMDHFLGGEFTTLGPEVLAMIYSESDLLSRIFPKVTKCTNHLYGPSGSIQKLDALCLLPQNVLNEKIFVFLWFWFLILALLSTAATLYRVAIILGPRRFRTFLLRFRAWEAVSGMVEDICNDCSFGEWFLLYLLAGNVGPSDFKKLLVDPSSQTGEDPIDKTA